MLATCPDNLTRDRALLLLGFADAFRRSELVSLEVAERRVGERVMTMNLRHYQGPLGRRGRAPAGEITYVPGHCGEGLYGYVLAPRRATLPSCQRPYPAGGPGGGTGHLAEHVPGLAGPSIALEYDLYLPRGDVALRIIPEIIPKGCQLRLLPSRMRWGVALKPFPAIADETGKICRRICCSIKPPYAERCTTVADSLRKRVNQCIRVADRIICRRSVADLNPVNVTDYF